MTSYRYEVSATRPPPLPVPAHKGKGRSRGSVPFDPEELSRRLYIVIAERETKNQRRERERAARAKRSHGLVSGEPKAQRASDQPKSSIAATKPAQKKAPESSIQSRGKPVDSHDTKVAGVDSKKVDEPHPYHHVPEVAASQFARTTSHNKSLVHKLSRKAIKFHMEGTGASQGQAEDDQKTSPRDRAIALKRAQSQREKEYERNQFQYPPIMEVAAEDHERQLRLAQRHTFRADFRAMSSDHPRDEYAKRFSDGNYYRPRDSSDLPEMAVYLEKQTSRDSHDQAKDHTRVDWSQSDENKGPIAGSSGNPHLRKAESKWALKSRLVGGLHKNKDHPPTDDAIPKSPNSLRASKSAFFARFKR